MIETSRSISKKELQTNSALKELSALTHKKIEMHNSQEIIQKLTHQELHIKFWKIYTVSEVKNSVSWETAKSLAVPSVIAQFIAKFNP